MKQTESTVLCARIVNCLQTILELEPMLQNMEAGHVLLEEFKMLQDFLHDLNRIELDESDVSRIENATELFLQELKVPMSFSRTDNTNAVPLQ